MQVSTNKTNQSGFGITGILAIVAVVALLGFGGWYVWQAQTTKHSNQTKTSADQTGANANTTNGSTATTQQQEVFKIPELGVEFEVKGGVTPLYRLDDNTIEGATYRLIHFSTQQLVTEGAKEAKAEAHENYCTFGLVERGHTMLVGFVYNSLSDTLKLSQAVVGSQLTESDITKDNGYSSINGKIYYIPRGFQRGHGDCIDTPYGQQSVELEQFNLLHDSLMTLRAIE